MELKCENEHRIGGYATADAKNGNGKVNFTKINLKTSRQFTKYGDTNPTTFTAFHNVSAFGNRAEELKDVKEGDFIRILGRAESRKYTDPTGIQRRIHEVIVESVSIVIPASIFKTPVLPTGEHIKLGHEPPLADIKQEKVDNAVSKPKELETVIEEVEKVVEVPIETKEVAKAEVDPYKPDDDELPF